jgi:hypothetical protein
MATSQSHLIREISRKKWRTCFPRPLCWPELPAGQSIDDWCGIHGCIKIRNAELF